jgi:hypothetical protein
MRREWELEDLIECWTLDTAEFTLLANKTGSTRLGFALMLKFFEQEARFPRREDVPKAAVEFVSGQVKVDAAESGTGALIEATFGPYTRGEQSQALDLLAAFTGEMLVMADRKFSSYTLARDTLDTGAHILWRASASFALRPVEVLTDGTYLARLYPARTSDGSPITVRVIEYTVHTTPTDTAPTDSAGGGGDESSSESSSEVFALVTDLLDVERFPASDLACAYPMRWGAETVIGHHKTDLGEGMPVLRSKDPEGVAQQMWALFAVYQATAQLIGAGADTLAYPTRADQLPARPARRDRHGHGVFPPLSSTWPSPPSSSRFSTHACGSASGPTAPAPARPRKPATSPPENPAKPP